MFPLIWMGGLVTSVDAGLSVPDWPNTFGYNMWSVPWGHWVGQEAGGVFYEHFHRLLGTLAGFFAVVTVLSVYGVSHDPQRRRIWGRVALSGFGVALLGYGFLKFVSPFGYEVDKQLWHIVSLGGAVGVTAAVGWAIRNRPDTRPFARQLAFLLLGCVCLQGLLGGLRVVLVSLDLAILHGIFGQLTLCVGGVTALALSRWWRRQERTQQPWLARPAAILVGACVLQLVVAAFMRHHDAGLAVPDFPLHYGQVMPPTNEAGLAAANESRSFDLNLSPVTLPQVWLHVAHRIGALVVTLLAIWVVVGLWRRGEAIKHAAAFAGLLLVQIGLGVATVWMRKPADVATFHVATGALLLLTAALLAGRMIRRYGLLPQPTPRAATRSMPVATPATATA
jgi:cytochrome c oxidase assembly protein subunit 15